MVTLGSHGFGYAPLPLTSAGLGGAGSAQGCSGSAKVSALGSQEWLYKEVLAGGASCPDWANPKRAP